MKHALSKIGCLMAMGAQIAFTPSAYAVLSIDLVNGNTGTANGAIYNFTDQQPTGTGVIDPFLRIQMTGSEQGYNTSAGTPFDTKAGPWTHDLQMKDLTAVNIGGTTYFEFLLDINEQGNTSGRLLSMNNVQIFTKATADTLAANSLAGLGTQRFDSDVGAQGDTTVELDYKRNNGSGSGDMLMYVPASLFAGATADDYVYFYSAFGNPNNSDAGFEEWAIITQPVPVPEPATVVAGLLLVGILGWRERSRIQQTFRTVIA